MSLPSFAKYPDFMSNNMPFGFGMSESGGPGGFDMNSLGAALQQLGQMMQSGNTGDPGPVNWTMVNDIARKAIQPDATVAFAQAEQVRQAVHLAQVWLDAVTVFPGGSQDGRAWSRSEWLHYTMPAWTRVVTPVAQALSTLNASLGGADLATADPHALYEHLPEQLKAMLPGGIPPEMAGMLAPMMGMMQQLGAAAFSAQLGQSLAGLAMEVVGASDIGIPLTDDGVPTLLPVNVVAFGAGIGVGEDDVRIYLAVREAAHQRLFTHVPWLRPRIIGALEEYAKGIVVDQSRLGDSLGSVDMSNPDALGELLSSGVLTPQDTPEQQVALARLETLMALVEGWVDDVVGQAVEGRLPTSAALHESVRRRRAAGGPAERTFASLVGMDLRPRLLREAATVFAAMRHHGDMQSRDGLWNHPDLLPDAQDLAEPLDFVERARQTPDFPA